MPFQHSQGHEAQKRQGLKEQRRTELHSRSHSLVVNLELRPESLYSQPEQFPAPCVNI